MMRTDEEILTNYSNVDNKRLILEVLLDIRHYLEEMAE